MANSLPIRGTWRVDSHGYVRRKWPVYVYRRIEEYVQPGPQGSAPEPSQSFLSKTAIPPSEGIPLCTDW
jgi:hypothetical protein